MAKQNKKINESLLFIRIGLFFFIQYTQGKYFVDDIGLHLIQRRQKKKH